MHTRTGVLLVVSGPSGSGKTTFESGIAAGDFLEHAEVHGNLYGTLTSEVLGFLEGGEDVVMDIDVQGAGQVRASDDRNIRASSADLFIMPPDETDRNVFTASAG